MGQTDKSKRSLAVVLAVLWVMALLLRLSLLPHRQVIEGDGMQYATWGWHLMRGEFDFEYSYLRQPLYPLLTGIFFLLLSDAEIAGRVVSLLLGTFTVLPVFFLTRALFGERAGLYAALLIVVHPFLVEFSSQVLTEVPYVFFVSLALWAIWRAWANRTILHFAGAGAAWALAYLVRPEALPFLFVALVLMGLGGAGKLGNWAEGQPGDRETGKCSRGCSIRTGALAALLCFLVFAFPYVLWVRAETGVWTISPKAWESLGLGFSMLEKMRAVYAPYQHPTDTAETDDSDKSVLEWAKGLVKRYVVAGEEVYTEHVTKIFPPLLLLFLGMGVFAGGWTEGKTFLLVLGGIACAIVPLVGTNDRYSMQTIPFLVPLVGFGIAAAQEKIGRWPQGIPQWLGGHVLVIVVLLTLLPRTFAEYLKPSVYPLAERELGEWMREHIPREAILMSGFRDPWVSYYFYGKKQFGGLPILPETTLEQVLALARDRHVDYLILSELQRPYYHSSLLPLLDGTAPPEGLEYVRVIDKYPGDKVVLYGFAFP